MTSNLKRLVWPLFLMILPMLACGAPDPLTIQNNGVRRAVVEYERAERGPVDELILVFLRTEPRLRFGEHLAQGGRTVWVYPGGIEEYFFVRSPERSYLYVAGIVYEPNRATAMVQLERSDANGLTQRELTLERQAAGVWTVIADEEL